LESGVRLLHVKYFLRIFQTSISALLLCCHYRRLNWSSFPDSQCFPSCTIWFSLWIFADFEQHTRPMQALSFLQFLLTLSKTGETVANINLSNKAFHHIIFYQNLNKLNEWNHKEQMVRLQYDLWKHLQKWRTVRITAVTTFVRNKVASRKRLCFIELYNLERFEMIVFDINLGFHSKNRDTFLHCTHKIILVNKSFA
jgi:hypothetical protein